MHARMCGWRGVKEKEREKKCEEKSNYFEGLSIIHEKPVFQTAAERCTRERDLSSLPILHIASVRRVKIRPPRGERRRWRKCSSSHAYEPFTPSHGVTQRRMTWTTIKSKATLKNAWLGYPGRNAWQTLGRWSETELDSLLLNTLTGNSWLLNASQFDCCTFSMACWVERLLTAW